MFTRRFHRQLTAWLAAMALLLAGLLPVMSHAVVAPPSDGQGWVEVCSASGMAWVKQATDLADAASPTRHPMPGSGLPMDPCDWCATHSPVFGLPHVSGPWLGPVAFAPSVPTAFVPAARPLIVWARAHSRAPPFTA